MQSRPEVALITSSSSLPPFGRIARWLTGGFNEIGVTFDAVYLDDPRGRRDIGVTRAFHLGERRSRGSVRPITQYLREHEPRMALVTPGQLFPFALAAGALARTPIVPWVGAFLSRDIPHGTAATQLVHWLQRAGYPGSHLVAAVSEDVRLDIADTSVRAKQIEVIPNPIDAVEIRANSHETAGPARPRDSLRFCTTGRLVPEKGIDVLIEAVALLRRSCKAPWEFLVIGDGPLRPQLERLAVERRVDDHVRFLGNLRNPYKAMSQCDVYVHPARWEGFGVALLEAASLGLPLIATRCPGGPHEIVGRDYGMLVPNEDPEGLADAMMLMADDAVRERLSHQSLARATAYAPSVVARRIADIAARYFPEA